jgi:hypothetical protein
MLRGRAVLPQNRTPLPLYLSTHSPAKGDGQVPHQASKSTVTDDSRVDNPLGHIDESTPLVYFGPLSKMEDPMNLRDKVEARQAAVQMAGGASEVARSLGLSRQAVHCWTKVPPRHVLAVEKLSGVSRHYLRPDIFGERAENG